MIGIFCIIAHSFLLKHTGVISNATICWPIHWCSPPTSLSAKHGGWPLISLHPPISPSEQTILYKDDPLLFGDEFRNVFGSIRRKNVRYHYDIGNIVEEDVLDLYKEWKDDTEYIILRGIKKHNQETLELRDLSYIDGWIYRFVKASKRGNDVYRYLVGNKLRYLEQIPNITFFKEDWGVKETNLLFITLTCDTKDFTLDPKKAWEEFPQQYHLFLSNLRSKYGHIEVFRTWESTKNFYPHAHLLVAFKDTTFPVFIHTDKKLCKSYRIPKEDKDKINSFWHSYVDVQGVNETKNATIELTKYITKDLCSDKGNKTNAMIWLHRMQSYSVSKGFVGLIRGQFAEILGSNPISDVNEFDLIKEMRNCNPDVENWEFFGVMRGKMLGFFDDQWLVELCDPPPHIAELLILEQRRQDILRGGR